MKLISTFLAILFFSTLTIAQNTIWNGSVDGDWHNATNWDNGVPLAGTSVSIFATSNNPVISGSAFAEQVIVSPDAQLTIDADGILLIDKSGSSNNLPGMILNADLINHGLLQIDHNTNGTGLLINTGSTLTNSGIINIGELGPISSYGIYNDGILINDLNGEISINDVNDGLINFNGALTNFGKIKIGETTQVNSNGISNYSTLDNHGDILIFTVSNNGIRNYGSAPFYGTLTNEKTGTIEIGTCVSGLRNEGTFVNHGTLEIDEVASLFAIDNRVSGILDNESCATIICNQKLENSSSNPITNNGFFFIDSGIDSNPGDFINHGILSDINGTFPITAGGYINNGIYLEPTSINSCETTSVLSIGGSGIYTIEGVYLDMAGTIPAGTYDLASNTFTNYASTGSYTFYINFEDANGACSVMTPWPVDVIYNNMINFTGNGNGTDWHDPQNWDLGIIPERCHEVIIPSSFNVSIASNNIGLGRLLCVDANAIFEVDSAAQLEICLGN